MIIQSARGKPRGVPVLPNSSWYGFCCDTCFQTLPLVQATKVEAHISRLSGIAFLLHGHQMTMCTLSDENDKETDFGL